jgi:hypothetical protein
MITIKEPKLKALLEEKDAIVQKGREVSQEIEYIIVDIEENLKKQEEITKEVMPPQEWLDEGDNLIKEINRLIPLLDEVEKKCRDFKIDALPKELVDQYYELKKKKDELEEENNKNALKVQKIKDKVVPKIKKIVAPQLAEYEDIEAISVVDDEIQVSTFNHLDEFKARYAEKLK